MFGALTAIGRQSVDTLRRVGGISEKSATTLKASFGLAAALEKDRLPRPCSIKTTQDTVNLLRERFRLLDIEELHVICVDGANNLICDVVVMPGTSTSPGIAPSCVFAPAIEFNAAAIILAHNHPSASCEPSVADIKFTTTIYEAGKHLRIPLLDHVIVGVPTKSVHKDYASFKELGIFPDRFD